ncbi:MAG TPA: NHL repeat-containing protein [Solirubrobacterales bacterium]|nr:NHL repeat-containing protein [Solirubrobacterales bacterium]
MSRGIATNPDNGHVFVGEQINKRISEYTAWGQFVRAWGWNVAGPGDPGDTNPVNQFEICTVVCQAGANGTGVGQFTGAPALALDSQGNVYVFDATARRAQKFSPTGQFLLMFGGGVNQGPNNPGNVCTAAHIAGGDTCGAGTTGSGNGQFGVLPGIGNYITVTPDDKVYVGDEKRIQRFDTNGIYQETLPDPEAVIGTQTVSAIASDSAGSLYVAFLLAGSDSKPNIYKLSQGGNLLTPTFLVGNPRSIALDPDGNLYTFDKSNTAVLGFNSAGQPIPGFEASDDFAGDLAVGSTGLAVNRCGAGHETHIYVSNSVATLPLRAYGVQPPDPAVCGDPPEVAPQIKDQTILSVHTDGALVQAKINPEFWADTAYFVEYGTEDCAMSTCEGRAPITGDIELGAGVVRADVSTAPVFLGGLTPGITYHYRFVAESGGGGPVRGVGGTELADGTGGTFTTFPLPVPPSACPGNDEFRTGPSAELPACRAYEMVSPVDKANGDVLAFPNLSGELTVFSQSAPNGNSLTYSSYQAFGDDALGSPWTSQYLARRDPATGWTSESLAPPRDGPSFYQEEKSFESPFKAFSEDLGIAAILQDTEPRLDPCAPLGFIGLYRRDNGSGSFESMICTDPSIGSVAFRPELQGFTPDGSYAAFRVRDALTLNAHPSAVDPDDNTTQCYLHHDGELHLLSVLPDGTANVEDCSLGTANETIQDPRGRRNSLEHAISEDGSRVFWTATGNGVGLGPLYMRINGDQDVDDECTEPTKACTVLISAGPTEFRTAAVDGSIVIYRRGTELFEYDVEAEKEEQIAAGVQGVIGASDSGKRVYFASTAALDGDAVAGQPNLYLHEGGVANFIATLASADVVAKNFPQAADNPIDDEPMKRSARVTPDGDHVVFMSHASLTGYDNTDQASGEPDAEVFLYNAGADALVCVSCNPSGRRPNGRELGVASGFGDIWAAAKIRGWANQLHATQPLSDDGSRLFFDSFDSLVLRDTNEKQDVYEWAKAGSGAECDAIGADVFVADSGGCLSLISTGESPADSEFLEASPTGDDVFIATLSSLTPQDTGLIDAYDARVGGGFPPPPPPPPDCAGEACQSPPAPPDDATPASSAFVGPGNAKSKPRAKRCGKGKRRVNRGGKARCVKKPTKQAKRGTRRAAR